MSDSNKTNYRWGLLGTGYAAKQFASGLNTLSRANLWSVASRSQSRADSFAQVHGIRKPFGSYEDLIDDPEVNIVYVGTTLPSHHELCLRCIDRGKAVLCEKPFAVSVEQATEIRDAALDRGVFCMEAMWSRFIPLMSLVRRLVLDGAIGEVKSVSGDFGLRQTPQSQPRLFDPVEGGALRDLGVYPISLAVQYLGLPDRVDIRQVFETSGVDSRAAGTLHYQSGAVANISADIRCQLPTRATLIGTDEYIEIQPPMYRPTIAHLYRTQLPEPHSSSPQRGALATKLRRVVSGVRSRLLRSYERIQMGYEANGYQYQAAEVMQCLDAGAIQSHVMPLQQSIDVLSVIELAIQNHSDGNAAEASETAFSTRA